MLVDTQAPVSDTSFEHIWPGAVATRAAAPANSITQNNPTQEHSNQTLLVTGFLHARSIKMTGKMNASPRAPRKMRYTSTERIEALIYIPIHRFQTAALQMIALQMMNNTKTTYRSISKTFFIEEGALTEDMTNHQEV
jgi:hypothetical protein